MLLLAGFWSQALGAPKADLWPLWDDSDESSTAIIDHAAWQRVLGSNLVIDHPSGIHRFEYKGASITSRDDLRDYLDSMQSIDPRGYSKSEQLAYWINLYNALTVNLVIERYGKPSILRMGKGLLSIGPWDEEVTAIAGHAMTLNDIEHRVLRPIWRDHRVHYALNCASLGCPNLSPEAYTAANTERLLAEGEKDYINHRRGVAFEERRLYVSRIYDWYGEDFAKTDEGLLNYLAMHTDRDTATRLRAWDGRIRYRYDWRLNQP